MRYAPAGHLRFHTLSGDGIILLTYTMSGPLASQFLIDVAYGSSRGPCIQTLAHMAHGFWQQVHSLDCAARRGRA